MAASDIIIEVRKRLGISRLKFAKRLGLGSQAIIWMYERKLRYPSRKTWLALVEIAQEVGVEVSLDTIKEI